MNLRQIIISYYQGEAIHGFWMAITGGLLLIGGLLLWKWALPFSLLSGFSVPMLLLGLLVSIGGGAASLHTYTSNSGKIALFQNESTTFLNQKK